MRNAGAAWAAVDYARPYPDSGVYTDRGVYTGSGPRVYTGRLPGDLPSPGLRRVNCSGKEKVKTEGQCRLCQEPGSWGSDLTRHHLVPEVWFRLRRTWRALWLCRNADPNIIPLCRPCHDRVEESESARRELRPLLAQDEVAFAFQSIGRAWLDATYPCATPR